MTTKIHLWENGRHWPCPCQGPLRFAAPEPQTKKVIQTKKYIYVTALSHTQQPFLKGLRESAMYYHLLLIQQMDRGVSHMTQASLFKLERFHVRPIVPIPPWIDGGVMGMVVGTFQGGGLSRKLTFAP